MANNEELEVKSEEIETKAEEPEIKNKKTLTKRDLAQFWYLQHFFQKVTESISYYYANGICASMLHCLRKLYADDEEGLKEALLRHLEVYISEGNCGSIILGAAMAMEEEKANGEPIDGSVITAFKTSCMGPMAGLGDTLIGFVIFPILNSIFAGFGMEGSYLCLLSQITGTAVFVTISITLFRTGYYQGRKAVLQVLRGNWLNRFVVGAGILGMLMMGCLGASYVSIAPTLVVEITEGNTLDLPATFDAILPGLVPFCFLMGGYMYLEKGKKATSIKLMLWYLVIIVAGVLLHVW